jgi:phosphonate transport system ATP-binding protein
MKRVDTLSGGQSQRVAIARVLMQKPKLLLADEPVASLDPVAAKTVMELLTELCKKEKITVIFTSHNVEDAVKYSDKILALKDGEISFFKASKTIDPKKLIAQYDSSVRFV